jgi:hypothetical protein
MRIIALAFAMWIVVVPAMVAVVLVFCALQIFLPPTSLNAILWGIAIPATAVLCTNTPHRGETK